MGNFNILPEEIQIEIISRLPIKSVLQCKLVSKPWKNLLQHPSFSQMHFNHHHLDSSSGNLTCCIFYSRQPYVNEFYYSEYAENCNEAPSNRRTRMNLGAPFENSSIFGSCNGLICFSRRFRKGFREWDYGRAYICNPSTREYTTLPNYGGKYQWNGFGYSSMTKEYKVVRICKSGGDSNVGIAQVYTLGSGKGWKNAGTVGINMQRICAGVFVNGALYWAGKDKGTIVAFHLDDENFSELPPPPPCLAQPGIIDAKLRVLGGFISVTYEYCSGDCDILLLKKNKDNNDFSWSKEFSFDSHISRPFEFTKSGRLLFYGQSV
ncbi:F-box protein At3g07870-like [Papaver somniferum]|uniref:F-box protein At3g07870-like n=1 Tax=Papaver somniferum TaxID=3469 RepID=UPI000E6F4B71|nr:F-box protein At3g07870-like [Papaver somniferum]XP_026388791.1 F-box protein At3g07870-like [Papaver somniferum]